jgi:hypothetical protein
MKDRASIANSIMNLRVITCILMSLFLFGLSGCDDRPQKVQQGMKTYLQDRYGIEFVVGQPYVTGSMDTAHYQAKAYPKGQPEIKFTVDEMSRLHEASKEYNPDYFRDYYLKAKWNYQGTKAIEIKMREIYGESVDMRVNYDFSGGGYANRNLDFEKVFEKSKNSGSHIYLNYVIFMDETQFNKETEASKSYSIIKPFVLDNKGADYTISILYIAKALKEDYLANPTPYFDKAINKIYQGNKEKKILCHFWLRAFPPAYENLKPREIRSSEDIIKFSEYQ